MSTLTSNQLAVLALVGSDASYSNPAIPFPFGGRTANGQDLQSYPDNVDRKDEYGFASALLAQLNSTLGSGDEQLFDDATDLAAQFQSART